MSQTKPKTQEILPRALKDRPKVILDERETMPQKKLMMLKTTFQIKQVMPRDSWIELKIAVKVFITRQKDMPLKLLTVYQILLKVLKGQQKM